MRCGSACRPRWSAPFSRSRRLRWTIMSTKARLLRWMDCNQRRYAPRLAGPHVRGAHAFLDLLDLAAQVVERLGEHAVGERLRVLALVLVFRDLRAGGQRRTRFAVDDVAVAAIEHVR